MQQTGFISAEGWFKHGLYCCYCCCSVCADCSRLRFPRAMLFGCMCNHSYNLFGLAHKQASLEIKNKKTQNKTEEISVQNFWSSCCVILVLKHTGDSTAQTTHTGYIYGKHQHANTPSLRTNTHLPVMSTNSISISDEDVNNGKAHSWITEFYYKAEFTFNLIIQHYLELFLLTCVGSNKNINLTIHKHKVTSTSLKHTSSFVDEAAVIKTGDGKNQMKQAPVPADVCQWRSGTRLCVFKSSSGCVICQTPYGSGGVKTKNAAEGQEDRALRIRIGSIASPPLTFHRRLRHVHSSRI